VCGPQILHQKMTSMSYTFAIYSCLPGHKTCCAQFVCSTYCTHNPILIIPY